MTEAENIETGAAVERAKGKKRKARRKRGRASNGAGSLLKRGKTYYARFGVGGKVVERSLHTGDEEEARAAMARLAVTYQGLADRQAVDKIAAVRMASLADVSDSMRLASLPISQLFELFKGSMTRGDVGVRTLKSYHCHVNVFEKWLGRKYPMIKNVRDVSQGMADEFIKDVAANRSPNSVNKYLNLFAMIWRTLSPRYGLEYNPWTPEKIARKQLKTVSRRALTIDECAKIVEAAGDECGGELRLLILVGIFTGYRLGDCVRLEWSHVDFDKAWIEKKTHKTGSVVGLPIAAPLFDALKEARARAPKDQPNVFPVIRATLRDDGNTDKVSRMVTRVIASVGIETRQKGSGKQLAPLATFHSLRHSLVSRLMERGVNPMLVKDAVGHSTLEMTAHYTHIGADALRTALNADAGAFAGKIENQ